MKLSLNVLNHLGLALYSNVPAVLAEIVANSWDADAEEVDIQISQIDRTITIIDNGHGMDDRDLNEKYLVVGYQRRESQESNGKVTAKWARPVMGRKGIGKLSVFSIAREVEVYSVKNSHCCAFSMSIAEIQRQIADKDSKGVYRPTPINPAGCPEDFAKQPQGTCIVLRNLKKRLRATAAHLRVRLARRFSVLGTKHHFSVKIDGSEVQITDRGYFSKLQYLWTYGDGADETRAFASSLAEDNAAYEQRSNALMAQLPVPLEFPSEDLVPEPQARQVFVRGWIGTVRESTDLKDEGENLNKIVLMVRGKLAQEDLLEEFNEGRLVTKYIIGEIHADFLDLDDTLDSATSSRQKIIEDDPRYVALLAFVRGEVRHIANRWDSLRDKEGEDEALKNPAIKEWFRELGPDLRKRAKSFFGKINRMPSDKQQDKRQLFVYAVLAFENLRYKGNLDALEKLSPENLEGLATVFTELNDVEATLYHLILKGRIDAIEALQTKVDDNARERLLQEKLYENLWLLDPNWERATDSEFMEQRMATAFDSDVATMTEEERLGRVDISYKKNSGKHVIIELKKAGRVLTQGDLITQGLKYLSTLQKILDDAQRSTEPMEVIFLLGKWPREWQDLRHRESGIKALAAQNMRVMLYGELLDNAYRAYKEFIDKRKEAGRLGRLLRSLDPEFGT